MHDLLQKIGLPATVAAAIAAIITLTPLLFKVDQRYAKEEDLKAQVAKLEVANTDLRHEVAQLAGFQQAMVALVQQNKVKTAAFMLDEGFQGGFMTVQFKPTQQPQPASQAASAPAPAASAPQIRRLQQRELEKPTNWRELTEGLQRQQLRLMKD